MNYPLSNNPNYDLYSKEHKKTTRKTPSTSTAQHKALLNKQLKKKLRLKKEKLQT